MSDNYYSANEKTWKIKILLIVLWILLIVVAVSAIWYTYTFANDLKQKNSVNSQVSAENAFKANVFVSITDENNENVNPQFLLIGFDGESKTISITEIPASTKLTAPERTDTIKNLFAYGSAIYVCKAINNSYGINVDRYIECSMSEVEKVVDKLGGIDYTINKRMQYENEDGSLITNLIKGDQKLNGNQYCQFLRYDKWGSESKKAAERVKLFVTLINSYSSSLNSEKILDIYTSVSNKISTNISIVEMNDFSLRFKEFTLVSEPASSTNIDFSDDEVSKVKLSEFYK